MSTRSVTQALGWQSLGLYVDVRFAHRSIPGFIIPGLEQLAMKCLDPLG